MVLAALGGLRQGWAGWRAQGLEGVGQGQGPWGSVGCSPPPLYGLPAWALAAASCKDKIKRVGREGRRIGTGKERNKEDEAKTQDKHYKNKGDKGKGHKGKRGKEIQDNQKAPSRKRGQQIGDKHKGASQDPLLSPASSSTLHPSHTNI